MLDVVFGQASDPGRIRTHNEDAAAAFVPRSQEEARVRGWMFAVADGVSGADCGEVASAKAVATMAEDFAESPEGTSLASLLPLLVQHANAAVHEEGLRGPSGAAGIWRRPWSRVRCGTDQAILAHVGDSRCYQVRDGKAGPGLTRDHTWVAEQLRLGLITAAEAEVSEEPSCSYPFKLGLEPFVTVEMSKVSLKPGDLLVLCTDGLHGGMYPEDIARITSQDKDIETIARELVDYSVEVDGADNATAQVIQVRSVESVGMFRGRR